MSIADTAVLVGSLLVIAGVELVFDRELLAADQLRSGPPDQVLRQICEDITHQAVERREFGALWQRESRHLSKEDQ